MRHRDDCTEFVAQPAGDKAVIDTLPKEANEAIIDAYKIGSTDSEEWTPFIAGTIFPVFLMPSVSSALIASLMMANSLPTIGLESLICLGISLVVAWKALSAASWSSSSCCRTASLEASTLDMAFLRPWTSSVILPSRGSSWRVARPARTFLFLRGLFIISSLNLSLFLFYG